MRRRRFAALLFLAIAVAKPFPAAARIDGLIDGSVPIYVLAVAKGLGDAELGLDGAGDPMIHARIGDYGYRVYFYGCTDGGRCKNRTFSASWTSDHYNDASMGDWNRSHRFGTAFIGTDGNPTLTMNVNLYGGVTRRSLEDTFDWWRVLMTEFSRYFGL